MSLSPRAARFGAALPTVLFVTSVATFVQAFLVVKVCCLAIFLLASISIVARSKVSAIYLRLAYFYVWMSAVGLLAAIVGWSNGNSLIAVKEGLRLRVLWSISMLFIYSLLRAQRSLDRINTAMVVSGILISSINLAGLVDSALGWGVISGGIRKELELFVGFHNGYIQITSNNIGTLFLIAPYLLALQFRADAGPSNSVLAKVSLVLCLIVAALSGRRGLWLMVGLTPCLVVVLSYLTSSLGALRVGAKRLLMAYGVALILGAGLLAGKSLGLSSLQEPGYVAHFRAAFSAQDERSIQKHYLVAAFLQSPIFGSGFGGDAGYVRSAERPWTYELTYHQMLFNLGIVGAALLGILFALYLTRVLALLRRFREGSAIPFGLLVGLGSLLIGAYSNPYLGSFDYLFFVGLLPYLATFGRGFEAAVPRPKKRVLSESRVAPQPQAAANRAVRRRS